MTTPSASTLQGAPVILSATSTSKLCEDYISSQNILLDLSSHNPIAVFQDYRGDTEAVAIRSDKQLIHIYRNWQQADTPWNIVEIGGTIQASEVVVGVDVNNVVQAFFRDDTHLYQIALTQDSTWTTLTTLPLCSNLQATVNPNNSELIISGVTQEGDLQFIQQSNGTWGATTIDCHHALLGAAPVLVIPMSITGRMNWSLGVTLNKTLNLYTGIDTAIASGPDAISAPSPADQVLLGYYHNQSAMFMFSGTDHALYTSVQFSDQVQTVPNTKTVTGAGLIKNDTQLLQVYSIDPDGTLWVLHQTGWDANNAPIWAPNIPLDVGLVQVAINGLPQDYPNLFGVSDDAMLHFIAKDVTSGLWSKALVQQPLSSEQATKTTYRLTTYRTQINIVDQFKNPQQNLDVTLSAQTEIAIWVEGKTYQLNANQTASLKTNALGTLTIVTPARGLHTPELTVTAANLPAFTFQPDGEIHTYMAGSGTLNTLPPLSGSTLQNAQVDGAPLAPSLANNPDLASSASQGIQHAMQTQPGQNGQKSLLEEAGVVGWALDLRDRNHPRFTRFNSHAEMDAYKQGAFAEVGETVLGDWWDDVKNFFEEVWNGIKSAAIAVTHWIVDTVNKVVSFIAKVGEELVHLANLVIKGIEEVISIVQSIFAAIEAFVEKVIKWLEAFFSWQDMIDTKNALKSALNKFGPYLDDLIETQGDQLLDDFFTKAEDAVKEKFKNFKAQFTQGQNVQSLITGAQASRLQAGARPVLAFADGTPVQPSDFSGHVQNNWLLDKIINYFLGAPDLQTISDLDKPLNDLSSSLSSAAQDFIAAMDDFGEGIKQFFTDPKDFGSVGVVDFLNGIEQLILAALKFADGVIKALLDTIAVVAKNVGELLTIPLEIPLITPLLNLIGIPDVSIADLFCLLAAIPMTLVYKLIHGADAKLFPGGVLPKSVTASDAADGDTKQAMVFVSGGLMVVWGLFDTGLDACIDIDPPFFLKVIDIIFPTLIQVFTWPTDAQIPFTPIPMNTPAKKANFANWAVGWTTVGLDLALLLAPVIPFSEGKKQTIARYIDPLGLALLTGLGCINMITGTVASVVGRADGATIAANFLSPIPNMTQMLRTNEVIGATEGISWAIKLVLDFFTDEGAAVATFVS
jgi:hypothetical protein